MEETPLLTQKSSKLDPNAPVVSMAVPLGTSSFGQRALITEPVKFVGHHERNQTEYTWLGSILTRVDSHIPPEQRRRISKFFPSKMSPQVNLFLARLTFL
jgi:hypothetical protein